MPKPQTVQVVLQSKEKATPYHLHFACYTNSRYKNFPTAHICMTALPPSISLQAGKLPDDAVEVAQIGPAWGVKGWFKVFPHNPTDPEAIFNSPCWYLQAPEQGARNFSGTLVLPIQKIKLHGDALVAHSPEMPDRTQAELLQGARVFVPRAAFPRLPNDEYYWVDLIGCQVCNLQGAELGVVDNLLAAGPQTTLVLKRPNATEGMIPFVNAFIHTVDIAQKRIVADWQPDYWD